MVSSLDMTFLIRKTYFEVAKLYYQTLRTILFENKGNQKWDHLWIFELILLLFSCFILKLYRNSSFYDLWISIITFEKNLRRLRKCLNVFAATDVNFLNSNNSTYGCSLTFFYTAHKKKKKYWNRDFFSTCGFWRINIFLECLENDFTIFTKCLSVCVWQKILWPRYSKN